MTDTCASVPHTHTTESGLLVKCYHKCQSWGLTKPSFYIAMFLTFPLEHALWTKVPFLHAIAGWAGL